MFNAEFELTNRCNTRCLHCPHEVMSRPSGRLSWETFEIVTGKIREHVNGEKFSLSFSGMGEPMLHPDIYRFIAHVSPHAFTSFATNGVALTEKNVSQLIEAGLDQIYFSFNGADAGTFSRMMGGLSYEKVLRNLRTAVKLSEGSRLSIWANVSVTKANREQLSEITGQLNDEGVAGICYSMGHTRGGTLHDPDVFDTPRLPEDVTHCEVLSNTLFIDWRGRVFICDHDVHGEHTLGDLVAEPISDVLARRQKLIDHGVSFRVCGECNDVLKMGVNFLPDGHSGTLRDWVYDVYRADSGDSALASTAPQYRWLYDLYARENRTDRMVRRLIDRSTTVMENLEQQSDAVRRLEVRLAEAQARAEPLQAKSRSLAERLLAAEQRASENRSGVPMRALASAVRKLVHGGNGMSITLVPNGSLEAATGGADWLATDDDPSFEMLSNSGRFPSGWVVVRSRVERPQHLGQPKIYYGFGDGYSEDRSISLPASIGGTVFQLVRLPKGIRQMRWDPVERSGEFNQRAVSISPIGILGRMRLRLMRSWNAMSRNSAVDCASAGLTWRRVLSDPQGAYEAASSLRRGEASPAG